MRKKTLAIIAAMFFGCNCVMQAQTGNEEITVTDDDGKEEVIDVPEAMNYEVDSLLNLYYSKTYLQPDNDCNYRDENKTYPKEVYIDRLSRLPNVMEMPYNDIVQQFIDRYTGRLRHSVSYMLGASNFYTPIFEEALEAYGLPLELKYLPVIESALNPMATSHAGAAGLWQFMVATGKQYGLEVNSLVDERRDPIKSSFAAARYLKDLYNIFGDWSLVIAAYNCGPENIKKAMHRAGGEADYWKIYPYLPRETRGYVPAFIAANYVMNYYCEHNICPMRTQLPANTDTIVVNRDVHLKQIAEVCGIELDELRTLNPQYRRDIVNGSSKPSIIRMPTTATNTFIANEDSIYKYNSDAFFTRRSLVEVDNSTSSSSVRKSSTKRRSSSSRRRRSRVKRVTIRQGDTLSEIAERNHTTVKKLRQLNGIRGNNIRAGKKIRVR
jgi:membrane-bound lytic murein transglycosylase D